MFEILINEDWLQIVVIRQRQNTFRVNKCKLQSGSCLYLIRVNRSLRTHIVEVAVTNPKLLATSVQADRKELGCGICACCYVLLYV